MLADLVALGHALLTIAMVAPILFAFKYKVCMILAPLSFLGIIGFVIIFDGCILTQIENGLREGDGLDKGFIAYYIENIFGITISTDVVTTITYFLLVIALAIPIGKFAGRKFWQT